MNEKQWLKTPNAEAMVKFITRVASLPAGVNAPSDRKLRLFSCAVCRKAAEDGVRVKPYPEEQAIEAAGWGELLADEVGLPRPVPERIAGWWCCQRDVREGATGSAKVLEHLPSLVTADILREILGNPWKVIPGRCDLQPIIRRCFSHGVDLLTHRGRVTCPRGQKAFRRSLTPTVLEIANAIYNDRLFQPFELSQLADALEEANCSYPELAAHFRSEATCFSCQGGYVGQDDVWEDCPLCKTTGKVPAQHWRGCWALDVILGKERRGCERADYPLSRW